MPNLTDSQRRRGGHNMVAEGVTIWYSHWSETSGIFFSDQFDPILIFLIKSLLIFLPSSVTVFVCELFSNYHWWNQY